MSDREGLRDGAELQRDLGLLGSEEMFQDPDLDSGLGGRKSDRHAIEVPLELSVEILFNHRGSSSVPGPYYPRKPVSFFPKLHPWR